MSEKEIPNYYAIIPANVRYSKIPPNAKLLYGEITALCNKEGYCWASNAYFGDLYGVSKGTVSSWISMLEQNGFIEIHLLRSYERRIFLAHPLPKKLKPPTEKAEAPLPKKLKPPTEKAEHNNTYNNKDIITDNNSEIFSNFTSSEKVSRETKKTFEEEKTNELIKKYEQAICDTTGKKYTLDTNKANQRAMKKLLELTGGDEEAIIETAKRSARYYMEIGTSMHESGKNASGVFVNISRLTTHVSKFNEISNAIQLNKGSKKSGLNPKNSIANRYNINSQ